MRFRSLYNLFLIIFLFLIYLPVTGQNQYSSLPALYLTTENNQPVVSKVDWLSGRIIVVSADTTEALNMLTEIRGRGNSTWGLAKKPYRIKLNKKTRLLNLPAKEKDWVLLANYADKTLIRNALAFKISQIVGMEFSPSVRFVDLVLNNAFLGNYMLTDQIEVNPARVNVVKQLPTDTVEPAITGGYLLEIDGFAAAEKVWFTTAKGLKISVKSPDDEEINTYQLNYIKNYIAGFENALFSADFKDPLKGYRSKVDTSSLINWYIASELTGNSDAFWSTYVYKNRSDDKLYFGPLWDYDIAFNNDNRLGDATQKLMSQAAHEPKTWIRQFLLDEWFQAALWRRWQELTSDNLTGKLLTYINETSTSIDESQQLNFQRWNNLNTRVYRETYLFSTYPEGVDFLKTYISNRISYLNTAFKYIEPDKPSVPFVPGNYYYMITNKKTNNVIDVANASVSTGAVLNMWEPQEDMESQYWEVQPVDVNYFVMLNKHSGLAMAGNGRGNSLTQINTNKTDAAQLWKIEPVLTGNIYGIVNKKSGYSINNSGGSFANGTKTIEYDNKISSSENQQWYFNSMGLINASSVLSPDFFLAVLPDVYPNPASSFVSIRIKLNYPQQISCSIYDISGRLCYDNSLVAVDPGSHVLTVPLNEFCSGVYFVTVGNEKAEKYTTKFIVSK